MYRSIYAVTRTPNEWMRADASDEPQFLGATVQGRVIFTCTVRDFQSLAGRYPLHAGILLAAQRSFSRHELIELLDRSLPTTTASEWTGQARWLSDWQNK